MRGRFILDSLGHPDRMRYNIRNCVDGYYEWCKDAAEQSHDGHCIPSCQSRVFPRDSTRYHLANHYMKQHRQREPRRPPGHTEAHCYQRAADPRCGRWRRPPVLVVHRNAQGCLSGGKDRARQYEGNDPDQPGRNPACPVFGW